MLLENPKTEGSRKSLLCEYDFNICSKVNFRKNFQILEACKPTKGIKDFFTYLSTHELNMKIVLGT